MKFEQMREEEKLIQHWIYHYLLQLHHLNSIEAKRWEYCGSIFNSLNKFEKIKPSQIT